jgi:hypothetical protein
VEVVAMASAQLIRRFAALGGQAILRAGVLTDNGHPVLDVQGLQIRDPLAMETEINQWPGVVTVGLFDESDMTLRDGATAYSPRVKELQRRFPYNLVNGRTLVEKRSDGTKIRDQPSFLVRVE